MTFLQQGLKHPSLLELALKCELPYSASVDI